MPLATRTPPQGLRRPRGLRGLVAALGASDRRPRVLEVVALRPADDLDPRWTFGGDSRVTRQLAGAVCEAATGNDGSWFRLDRLVYAVLAPAGFVPGTAAMAARRRVSTVSESLASCVFHGSVTVPDEATGNAALDLALSRLQTRARRGSHSTERQVRDVLRSVMGERHMSSPQVSELAVRVGRSLGLGPGELDVLVRAAEMTDLGKMLIPDAIALKRTPLSPEEWAIVRRHPVVAAEILAAAPATVPVAELVRCSQERHGGTGYPDGLSGDAIPIAARIIAVCVAFDAMTTDRPYRAAAPVGLALAELRRCAGEQFDPAIVDAFCAVFDEPPAAPAADTSARIAVFA